MEVITISKLKDLISKYPDNFKILIPIHSNEGIVGEIDSARYVDYDEQGKGWGEFSSSDGNCDPYPIEQCNAVLFEPTKDIYFDDFSSDDKEINDYLKLYWKSQDMKFEKEYMKDIYKQWPEEKKQMMKEIINESK